MTDPEFDFRGPEVAAAQAGDWRAESPIGLVVLRYAEAQELLRDPRLRQSGENYLAMNGVVDGPLYDWYLPMIINQDGEDHRRLRGLVSKAFTLRMVNNLRPGVRAAAERLADRLAAAGAWDFVEEYADRLPLAVMSELLGIPAEDHEIFRRRSTDIGLVFSLAHGGDIRARVETAVTELHAYVDGLMDDKRAHPGSDLVSALVAMEPDDEHLSLAELRNFIVALVFAAHDATLRQLAHAMVAFAEHPEQWTVLARRPQLLDKAVEEVMRWAPTTTTVHRFATADFDFRSVRLTSRHGRHRRGRTGPTRSRRLPRRASLRHHRSARDPAAPVRRRTAPLPRRGAGARRTRRSPARAHRPLRPARRHRPHHLAASHGHQRPGRPAAPLRPAPVRHGR
ncbi:cytochrome P450 [Streptomyces lasalocidi]